MYTQVHPCAKSFNIRLSTWYRIHEDKLSYENCWSMEAAAAWRAPQKFSGELVECIPIWNKARHTGQSDTKPRRPDYFRDLESVEELGDCFIAYKFPDGPQYGTLIYPD
jgi:hypothetical protein